jgi:tetrahydromethanopterin S-methyltransferase subunit G
MERDIGKLQEQARNHEREILALHERLDEITNCVRRIERKSWAAIGQQAGVAILLAIVLAKFGGF